MSNLKCDACDDLRDTAPEFVNEGVNDKICASLQNDTGLNPDRTTCTPIAKTCILQMTAL